MTVSCQYCGSDALLADSSVIYGKSYGLVYICGNYPRCDSYVGVHKGSNKPKGTLANRETREARKRAHAAFDPLWKTKKMHRKEAYAWLSGELAIIPELTHIGMFDVEQCNSVVEACQRYKGKKRKDIPKRRNPNDLKNLYFGDLPPWEYPTFIKCYE